MTAATKKKVVITERSGARRVDIRTFFRSEAGRTVLQNVQDLTKNAKHLRGFEPLKKQSG